MLECKQCQIQQFLQIQGPIHVTQDSFSQIKPIIEHIQIIHNLTKIGADWLIFVDARV